jgi:hypothetical protein
MKYQLQSRLTMIPSHNPFKVSSCFLIMIKSPHGRTGANSAKSPQSQVSPECADLSPTSRDLEEAHVGCGVRGCQSNRNWYRKRNTSDLFARMVMARNSIATEFDINRSQGYDADLSATEDPLCTRWNVAVFAAQGTSLWQRVQMNLLNRGHIWSSCAFGFVHRKISSS